MATFYFVRHAESEMNLKADYICGRSEATGLSEEGQRQAKKLGIWVGSHIARLDRVASSPAVRSRQTIDIAVADTPFAGYEIELDDRLHEMTQGPFEGLLRADVYTPEVREAIEREGLHFALPGGESMRDVGERMFEWVEEKMLEHDRHVQVLAGTHGIAIKCLAGYLYNRSQKEIFETKVDNASVNILQFNERGYPSMRELNIPTR